MDQATAIIENVRKALRSEPRIDFAHHPLNLSWADRDLTIEGEVGNIVAKKLTLERAAATAGVGGIIDRLRVVPAQRMGDDQIRDLVCDVLLGEEALANCALYAWDKHQRVAVRALDSPRGTIDVKVAAGVVTLDGDVPGLVQKRLAGVLAWWVPGSQDVVNGLGVAPPEEDNDFEITDAVRIAFEKDPFVTAEQIRVATHNSVVTLQGVVPTAAEREMAEFDAWYVFGVDKVINNVEVHR